jgi:carboxyvinyl-carboxyphosphonate phosphorylmutase
MKAIEKRQRLRRMLNGKETILMPAVYDAVSARIAEITGFEAALLSGSVAAASLHGYPDLVLVTMTEVAQLAKRIADCTTLSLQVDCDNGFGNALNVMRCVREFEAAGAASLTLEDTDLPRPYGAKSPSAISTQEMCGKLEAAVEARKDSEMVIVGRTDTFRFYGINEALERVRAYQETGVDAIFVPGLQKREDLEKIRKHTSLPAISSGLPKPEGAKSGLDILQEIGFSMTVLAKYPFMIIVKTLHDSLSYLRENGEWGPFEEQMGSTRMLEDIIRADQYADYQKRFMLAAKNSSIQKKF